MPGEGAGKATDSGKGLSAHAHISARRSLTVAHLLREELS